jgi:hypothetical protein
VIETDEGIGSAVVDRDLVRSRFGERGGKDLLRIAQGRFMYESVRSSCVIYSGFVRGAGLMGVMI